MTPQEFAARVRAKYPDGVASDGRSYADIGDEELTQKIVAKYPVYASQVKFEQPTERPVGQDVAIGTVKQFGSTIKETGDMIVKDLPSRIAGPVAGALPMVRDAISDVVEPAKEKLQSTFGLTDENLEAENTAQKVGKGIGLVAELAGPFAWSKVAKLPSVAKASIDEVADLADKAKGKILDTAENVLEGTTDTAALKAETDAVAAPVSFRERLAGLAPDIKSRIQGKGKLFADYMNITDARNNSDLAPTPLEYGASFANKAKQVMEGHLSNTGSQIGRFREKIATYQVTRDTFNQVRNSFNEQLNKLNLEVAKGKVRRIPGKIAQTISDGEIRALQALYKDLEVASQGPSLENLIDLRNKFGNKINFDKLARDVSNTLDPLSRVMRNRIKTIAADVVGKSEAKNLEAYSKFMDAYDDLRSFVDRRAGAEFLLKRVFSERGGEPRAIMETIRQYTGIDLMDHAIMAKVATELGGNAQMQGLFRQEITKAGMDAFNLMRGNPVGVLANFAERSMDALLDKRKIFEKAANSPN